MCALHSAAVYRGKCSRRDGPGGRSLGGRERRAELPARARLQGSYLRARCRQAGGQELGPFRSGSRARDEAFGPGREEPGQRPVRHRPGDQRRADGRTAEKGRSGCPRAGNQRGHLRAEQNHAHGFRAGTTGGRFSYSDRRRARLVSGEPVARGRKPNHPVRQHRLRRVGTGRVTAEGHPTVAPGAGCSSLHR